MASNAQKTVTMEDKIDMLLEQMKKIDNIEKHMVLLQNDMSGIKSNIKELDTRMTDIENSMSFIETDFTEIKETVKQEATRTKKLEAQIEELKKVQEKKDNWEEQKQIEHLKYKNELLTKHINDIDTYNRRSNLIFEGIQESMSEDPWRKVQDLLYEQIGIDATDMKIERCHRLYGSRVSPKPIIVRFNWYADRQEVWANRRYLKGTSCYIREDFPPEVQRTRRSLSHTLKLARSADKKATLKNDNLIFKGKSYQADNIPSEVLMLGEAGPGARVINGQVCFSGRASPFSNFFRAPFVADGKTFETNEHYYQYNKAKASKDDRAAAAILADRDPARAKQIGEKVQAHPKWYGNMALNVMTGGIVHKFQQNENVRNLLIKCASLRFVECSQYDKYWGNGLKWTDAEVGNPSKWKGKNMLGACLNEAVKHFKKPYSQTLKT